MSRAAELVTGTRLRLARQVRGFSQQQLAGMAGVSRQAVSAVESGQSDPSLRVALALASALGLTVDELFGAEGAIPTVTASLIAPAAGPQRVTLAPVGDSFVALPLAGPTASRAGFLPAGGRITGPAVPAGAAASGQVRVRPIGPPKPTLVVAGCDPALPLLSEPLSLLDPPIAFSWWPCATREALRLSAAGLVHVAGVHLSGQSDAGQVAELVTEGGEVIGFSAWREGLVLRPAQAGRIASLTDVIKSGLRLVNREPGAEARSVLDRELAAIGVPGEQVPGYETRATGHLQVAEAVAAGLADAGVASDAGRAGLRARVPAARDRALRPRHPGGARGLPRGAGAGQGPVVALAARPASEPARLRSRAVRPAPHLRSRSLYCWPQERRFRKDFLLAGGGIVAGRAVVMQVGGVDLLVETSTVASSEQTSALGKAAGAVAHAFDGAQSAIVAVATSTVNTIAQLGHRSVHPDEMTVTFGLKFSAQGNVIVAGAAGEATLEVTLTYRRLPEEAEVSGDVEPQAEAGAGDGDG